MKIVGQIAAQGELLVIRVEEIPDGVAQVEPANGRLVVGHSETGHHHAIEATPDVQLFEVPGDPLEGFLKVGAFANLVHMRDYDTHETLRLPHGNYKIRRQREHSIDGWQPVLD